jgi:hypothetical protein
MIKNNRHSPRIETNLPVEVENHSGEIIEAHLVDLSITGLSLCGDMSFIDHIEEKDPASGESVFPVEVNVRFVIDMDETTVPVSLHARRVHVHRQSMNEYHCGFMIIEFQNDGHEVVSAFIQRAIDGQGARALGMPYIPAESGKSS